MEREELDEQIKVLAAKAEEFMKSCGQEELEIYRIEKFVPTKVSPEFHGKFYSGDSYVIVKKNEKDYDIHYWHGKYCSSDESATSAAFTVQLSGYLPMLSRHHLQLMEEESA